MKTISIYDADGKLVSEASIDGPPEECDTFIDSLMTVFYPQCLFQIEDPENPQRGLPL